MGWLFSPAVGLLGRLRYAYKILVVPVVLLLLLGFVAKAYVDLQRSQVAFSAKERVGVAYLVPLLDLTARVVTARHLAVTGDERASGVQDAIARVDAATGRYGAELDTVDGWNKAKQALTRAGTADGPPAAFDAYNAAVADLLALIVKTSDESNLTLDPDLDTYYLMDALVFRLPILLDTAGRAVDQAALARAAGDASDPARPVSTWRSRRHAGDHPRLDRRRAGDVVGEDAEHHLARPRRGRREGGARRGQQVIDQATQAAKSGDMTSSAAGRATSRAPRPSRWRPRWRPSSTSSSRCASAGSRPRHGGSRSPSRWWCCWWPGCSLACTARPRCRCTAWSPRSARSPPVT